MSVRLRHVPLGPKIVHLGEILEINGQFWQVVECRDDGALLATRPDWDRDPRA